MSAPMVRALLAGTKSQTRRIVKLPENARNVNYYAPPGGRPLAGWADPGVNYWTPSGTFDDETNRENLSNHIDSCPYGYVGSRLWVREAFRLPVSLDQFCPAKVGKMAIGAGYKSPWSPVQYEADGLRRGDFKNFVTPPMPTGPGRYRHSRHMPRWLLRITLEITDVRVQRLQEITEADAIAEGVESLRDECEHFRDYVRSTREEISLTQGTAVGSYRTLWESLHGAGSWDASPWVWVVEFQKATVRYSK